MVDQIFDDPGSSGFLQMVGCGPMLPYGVAECFRCLPLQLRLREKAAHITGKGIAASALCQIRVA